MYGHAAGLLHESPIKPLHAVDPSQSLLVKIMYEGC